MSSGENSHFPPMLKNDDPRTAADVEADLAGCRRANVPIDAIRVADSVRLNGESAAHIKVLAEVEGKLPAIVLHRSTMRVIDGMHRLRAAELRGDTRIDVLLYEGSEGDAFVLAIRLNAAHGLPLSKADRAAAAKRIIASHGTWSDRAIAAITGLSPKTVAPLRQSVLGDTPSVARVGKDGRVRALNLADARRYAGRLFTEKPDASLREVARKARISVGTARDVRQRLREGADPVPLKQRQVEQKAADRSRDAGEGPNFGHVDVRIPQLRTFADLDQLKRDPSIRFTDMGRNIIRLMEIGTLGREPLQRYAGMVPMHLIGAVVRAARSCAKAWEEFARQLERRDAGNSWSAAREISVPRTSARR